MVAQKMPLILPFFCRFRWNFFSVLDNISSRIWRNVLILTTGRYPTMGIPWKWFKNFVFPESGKHFHASKMRAIDSPTRKILVGSKISSKIDFYSIFWSKFNFTNNTPPWLSGSVHTCWQWTSRFEFHQQCFCIFLNFKIFWIFLKSQRFLIILQ